MGETRDFSRPESDDAERYQTAGAPGPRELQVLLADYWHDVDANWGRNAGTYYTQDADFVGEAATYSGRAKIQEFYTWRVSQGPRLAVHAVNNFPHRGGRAQPA